MPAFYRAFFRCQADNTANLTVDLLLDDRRRWIEKVSTGGWWGRLDSDDVWPFILKAGGLLDFGETDRTDTDAGPRYGEIDISNRIMAVGERYSMTYGHDRSMTLERMTDILAMI